MKESIYNIDEIKKSSKCGCYFCISVQNSADVVEFVDDGTTGLCPNCGIDSLLPNETNLDTLAELNEKRFAEAN